MKKLLLLSSFVWFGSLFASCQNSTTPKTENVVEPKKPITTTPVAQDTTKGTNQTSSSGTVGTGGGKPKDTTATHPVKGNAIVHSSPNQTKIDSIKKSKKKK